MEHTAGDHHRVSMFLAVRPFWKAQYDIADAELHRGIWISYSLEVEVEATDLVLVRHDLSRGSSRTVDSAHPLDY